MRVALHGDEHRWLALRPAPACETQPGLRGALDVVDDARLLPGEEVRVARVLDIAAVAHRPRGDVAGFRARLELAEIDPRSSRSVSGGAIAAIVRSRFCERDAPTGNLSGPKHASTPGEVGTVPRIFFLAGPD